MIENNKSPLTDKEASILLLDYFKGFISEANRQRIDEWRASSIENQRKFDAVLELIMDVRSLDVLTSTDVEAALERVNARIIYERRAWLRNLERVAAVLAIPLLAATIWLSSHLDTREPIYCEMRTETGVIGHVVLPLRYRLKRVESVGCCRHSSSTCACCVFIRLSTEATYLSKSSPSSSMRILFQLRG